MLLNPNCITKTLQKSAPPPIQLGLKKNPILGNPGRKPIQTSKGFGQDK